MGWFKVWDEEWLNQTLETNLETQGAMIRAMCSVNQCFDDGRFTYRKKAPLPLELILKASGLSERQWGLLVESKFVHKEGGTWLIRNWKHFQSEYARQKGYRVAAKK